MASYVPELFPEKDPSCKFKLDAWLWKDGKPCKKPHCLIGAFECQWIDNCIPCPLRWQWGSWDGWKSGSISPEVKIRIVNDAKRVVTTLADAHTIDVGEVKTIYDLLAATKTVQSQLEGSEATQSTLTSIVDVLMRIGTEEEKKKSQTNG